VSSPPLPRIEIDGRAATAEQLRVPAMVNYGHFTAAQVRNGAVRGLGLHLRRLDAATRELFGTALDGDRVRDHVRHALGDDLADASVRITVVGAEPDCRPSIMVTVRAPAEMPGAPRGLQTVAHLRPLPHIKHVGTFGQIYFGRLAERNGFDDALLTGPGGLVAEGAITNIAFFDGSGVVWPDAPALDGVTMQLLEARLGGTGLPSRRAAVRLADVPSYAGAFVTNSRGVAPVGRIDDLRLPVDTELMAGVLRTYEAVAWDPI
jgi:branched-subunit amino acid aminotransferase/4-amino-4-deoxychorismate lyase